MTVLSDAWITQTQVLFVKMDAEGHEPFVLKGASKMMSTAPPAYILMEYYPHVLTLKNVTSASLMQMVYGYGYRVYDCNKKVRLHVHRQRCKDGLQCMSCCEHGLTTSPLTTLIRHPA